MVERIAGFAGGEDRVTAKVGIWLILTVGTLSRITAEWILQAPGQALLPNSRTQILHLFQLIGDRPPFLHRGEGIMETT